MPTKTSWNSHMGNQGRSQHSVCETSLPLNSYSLNLEPTRWNKILPAKVNILSGSVWHIRIPTRLYLYCWGIELDTVCCPVCDGDTQFEEHIFIYCKVSNDTWKAIFFLDDHGSTYYLCWWHDFIGGPGRVVTN